MVYFLYRRNTSEQGLVPRLLFSPSQQLFGLVTQRHLFPDGERARSVMRPNNSCERDRAYCRSSAREKSKIIRQQLDA